MVDILLVEDNKELSMLMNKFMSNAGYSVYCAYTGEQALEFASKETARLVILDIMLPGIDGFAVCMQLRKTGDIPVMILSARTDKESKMSGYRIGADDYIEKPVDIDIMLAKIEALFSRYYDIHDNGAIINSGEIVINQDTMEVTYKGNVLNLTIKEYDLLRLLIENKGKTLGKDYLFNQVWGSDSFSENQTLTVHIKMLRDKIEDDSKNPVRIKTVWGVGYRYEEV